MEQENKSCKNCKYGIAHYMINCTLRFVRLENEMHCSHRRVNKSKFNECFKGKKTCEYWESNELQQIEKTHKIKSLLEHIYNRLDQALQILEEMKNDE